MELEAALIAIQSFWNKNTTFPFEKKDNRNHLERIESEFGHPFPQMVREYIGHYAPVERFSFDTVGNPVDVYAISDLKFHQEGYNYNPVKKEAIEGWDNHYFIFADEGADPVIIDLRQPENGIQLLIHGTGSWDYGDVIADSFGQFLVCSAARHHALNSFEEDPIVDDETGFNLADNAAKWYFKNMKNWAGDYYESWCSVFDNH